MDNERDLKTHVAYVEPSDYFYSLGPISNTC